MTGARTVLAIAALVGCASPERSPTSTPAARPSDPAARAACISRCERHVETRHDACGPGATRPWPDWCAESNRRMRDDCVANCP